MPVIAPVADRVLKAPVLGVVAPTVPLCAPFVLIDAVPVRFVTVPLAGVPRIAPLPNVATPVTLNVLLNVPVVAATDDGVVAPSGCGVANNCVIVVLRSAVSAALCRRMVSAATGTVLAVWSVIAPGNRIAEST